ncbi:Amyloid-Beta A4 Precursor Protein-Binding Family A Member 3 [Manis pentadactyla]|nr:Amyloid-Beta A4 Precursor Protein-Binding Family A Member 3 [Manis pentadactyla]
MEGEFKKADPVQDLWIVDRLEKDSNYIFRLGSEMLAGAWDPSMEFLTTSAPPPGPPALDLKEPRDAFAFQDLNINPQGPEAVVLVSECTLPPSSLMAKAQEVIDIVKKINQHVFC